MKVKGRDKGGMKMYKYEVGQVIERFKGRQEGLDYARKLNKIFNTYSTKEMVNYSEVSCRIK